jgi:hypothetical protein
MRNPVILDSIVELQENLQNWNNKKNRKNKFKLKKSCHISLALACNTQELGMNYFLSQSSFRKKLPWYTEKSGCKLTKRRETTFGPFIDFRTKPQPRDTETNPRSNRLILRYTLAYPKSFSFHWSACVRGIMQTSRWDGCHMSEKKMNISHFITMLSERAVPCLVSLSENERFSSRNFSECDRMKPWFFQSRIVDLLKMSYFFLD